MRPTTIRSDDNDVKHLSLFVYFQWISWDLNISGEGDSFLRLEMIRPGFVSLLTLVQLTTGELPSSFTKTLLFFFFSDAATACRTHFMAIIAWNAKLGEKCKIGWKMSRLSGERQIVVIWDRWSRRWGAGGTFDAEKAGGATTLKQSDSFICFSLFGSSGCNCQKWKKHKRICQLQIG